jgi:hypothetical protein
VSRLGVRNADIFNFYLPKNKAEDKEGAEKLDEKAIRQTQINDVKAYLKDEKIGEISFKEYKATTYQEEEVLLAEDLKDELDEKNLNKNLIEMPSDNIAGVLHAIQRPRPIYFYHQDHLGSSTFLTDANGIAYQIGERDLSNTNKNKSKVR